MGKILNKSIIAPVKGIGATRKLIDEGTVFLDGYIVKHRPDKTGYLAYTTFTINAAGTVGSTIKFNTGMTNQTYKVEASSSSNGAAITGGISVDAGIDAYSFAHNLKEAIYVHSGAWHIDVNKRGIGVVDMWQVSGLHEGNTDITLTGSFEDSCSVNPTKFFGGSTLSTSHTGTSAKNRADNEIVSRLAETTKQCREEVVLWNKQRPWKIQAGWFTSGSDRIRIGAGFGVGGDESAAVSLLHFQFYKNSGKDLGTTSQGTKATGVLRFTDSMAENDHIVLECPPQSDKYLAFRGTTSGSNGDSLDGGAAIGVRIETGGTAFSRASDFCDNLEVAMEHANAFGSNIALTQDVSSGTHCDLTITNEESSHRSNECNVEIQYSDTSHLAAGQYATAFTGGNSEHHTDEYITIGNSVHVYKLPYFTNEDNTYIKEIQVKIISDGSEHSDHQGVPFRVDAYGGCARYTSSTTIPNLISSMEGEATTTQVDSNYDPLQNAELASGDLYAMQKLGSSAYMHGTNSTMHWLDGNERSWDLTIPVDKVMVDKNSPIVVVFKWLDDDANIDLLTTPAISTIYGNVTIIGGIY